MCIFLDFGHSWETGSMHKPFLMSLSVHCPSRAERFTDKGDKVCVFCLQDIAEPGSRTTACKPPHIYFSAKSYGSLAGADLRT